MKPAPTATVSHGALGRFQDDFALALMAAHGAPSPPSMTAIRVQPGFAVYRNTVMKACVDALQANYPAVAKLVGDVWFRAAAAVYTQTAPPANPVLLHYGESFPAFLATFEPAIELPYLPGVARLDRLWTEVHTAADQAPLNPAALAGLPATALATCVLHPHAAARWVWFAGAPVYSIWAHNRSSETTDEQVWEPQWKAQGALLTRPNGAVDAIELDAPGYVFLQSCAANQPLAQAAAAALAVDGGADLQTLTARLLCAGAFAGLTRSDASPPPRDS